jgi:putative two-component system response regulator
MSQRILVVDDQPACTDMLVRLLSSEGFTVDVAANGQAALASTVRNAPDVVVLDVALRDINGFDVCRSLKQNPDARLTPVVLLTGLASREHRVAGLDAGADAFVAKPFDSSALTARVKSLSRLKRFTDNLAPEEAIIVGLSLAVEARDPFTEGHCERLAEFAAGVGEAMGLRESDVATLRCAGLLHDVGKVGIPPALLLKPGRLNDEEFELVKRHTVIGERVCSGVHSLAQVAPIVRQHHERLDGSGYPDGLRGDEISPHAQIVGIVDAFDAMTTTRPYRPAMSTFAAFQELRTSAQRGAMSRELVEALVFVASMV